MPEIAKGQYGRNSPAAAQSGFVVGRIEVVDEGGRGFVRCWVQDAGGNVLRDVSASAHYYPPHDAHIRYNALTMPVLAGEIYVVDAQETVARVSTRFDFVPFV